MKPKRCEECNTEMPNEYPYAICAECYEEEAHTIALEEAHENRMYDRHD